MAEIQRIACVSLVVVAPSRVAELSPTQRDVITARGLIRGFHVICRAGSKHAPQRLRQARARADAALTHQRSLDQLKGTPELRLAFSAHF